ncbi:MAG: dockerin type I repeat-containing protein [Christensenellales bacterium]
MEIKKAISLALAFMLAAVVLAAPAGACETPDEQVDALYLKFCAHYGYTPYVTDPQYGPVDRFKVCGYSGDFALCYASHNWFLTQPAYYHVQIGGYTAAPESWGNPDPTFISAVSLIDDTVYGLEEAALAGAIDMADVKEAFPGRVKITGDWDNDSKLSLNDVLALQKYIAKIIEAPGESYTLAYFAADFNDDGRLDLNDALAMQKTLAKAM